MTAKLRANKERMFRDVAFLTQIDPPRSYAHPDSLDGAADYIEEEFSKLGCTVENQNFTVRGREFSNIIASFNTTCRKRLIVGAHYDVCGDIPGADDNASAIAGLLECARLISENQPALDYRIDFVAFCLEEPPFFGTSEMGSAVHARSLLSQKEDVLGMICLDMIGYFSEDSGLHRIPFRDIRDRYPRTGDYIIVAGRKHQQDFADKVQGLMQQQCSVQLFAVTDTRLNSLLELSDHRNYWQYGFNAVMINDTAMIRNANYHTEGDTIETLNFDKMAEVVNGCYHAVVNM